jgi:RecA/RadA recombinase
LQSGLLTIAGKSKHFKSLLGLIACGAYMQKNKEAVMIFYDSEFGAPDNYFDACGIDRERVMHIPVKSIEELKFDIVKQLESFERKDKVIIFLDSIGNIASKKELDDAINDKSVADMTRAKAIKSLFRMVTPYLTIKDIPMIAIAHVYDTQTMYSTQVVSGGTGLFYASNDIWIMGRRQEKEGTEVIGYNFIINIEKSRTVKEKSKIPICVTYDGGVSRYSGLIDMAMEGGFVYKPKNGWYRGRQNEGLKEGEDDLHDKSYRLGDTNSSEFWNPIFEKTNMANWVKNKYSLGQIKLLEEDKVIEEAHDLIQAETTTGE